MQSYPSYIINNGQGSAGRNSSDALTLSETTTVNYRWEVNENHSLNFLLGQEAVDYQSTGFQVVTRGQASDLLTNVTSGTRASQWADSNDSYSYLSFFFRGEYNYKDLYYGEVAARTDASSRFGKDHRWGVFWSLGFMWNIKNEAFLKDTIDWGGVAATYIGIPLFLIIWFGYKLIKGTHFVRYSEMKFPQNDKK